MGERVGEKREQSDWILTLAQTRTDSARLEKPPPLPSLPPSPLSPPPPFSLLLLPPPSPLPLPSPSTSFLPPPPPSPPPPNHTHTCMSMEGGICPESMACSEGIEPPPLWIRVRACCIWRGGRGSEHSTIHVHVQPNCVTSPFLLSFLQLFLFPSATPSCLFVTLFSLSLPPLSLTPPPPPSGFHTAFI